MMEYSETIIDEENEPWCEPEDCEHCSNCEHVEYERSFTWKNAGWVCDWCGGDC
jgi:hypothetical protein